MAPSIPPHQARSAAARTGSLVRAAAFWTAVALPVVAVCLLAVRAPPRWVGLLLLCNVVALVVGHGHRIDRPSRER